MIVQGKRLILTRGDTANIGVVLKNDTFAQGDKVEMTVRKYPGSAGVVFHKLVEANEGASEVLISIEAADTSEATPGAYYYDVQLTHGSNVRTLVAPERRPNFIIGEECTY